MERIQEKEINFNGVGGGGLGVLREPPPRTPGAASYAVVSTNEPLTQVSCGPHHNQHKLKLGSIVQPRSHVTCRKGI